MEAVDRKTVSTIRALCADTVEKANSGHPGLPLGSAAAAYILWGKVMKHSGTHRKWVNRDRFILSGGHGSSLLYSLLHLYNYGLTIEDLRQFRQLDSLTPGHPEYGHTVGVEATTGPLGAGMAMATGMAMAQAHLAAIFNRPGYPVFDSFTYVLGGDGCLMEGISSEAFSLAGTLKLEKLIVLYDSNNISIEGSTDIAFREDVQGRMKAFGFDTFTVEDGDDLDEILSAINQARVSQKPAFIEVKTRIGKGCPAKEGKASAHGEPLGEENVRELKRTLGLDEDRTFAIDEEVYLNTAKQQERSEVIYKIWKDMFDDYLVTYPEMKKLWKQYFEVDYNKVLENDVEFWKFENKPESTRNLSGTAMNRIKELFPNFMGGSADLAPSTKTYLNKVGDFSAENYRGRNLHYGVREQAMTGIGNGIMLYGGLKTFVSTFFVFSDYVKPMARLSALMNLPLIYVLTHDSIGVGEDGPTHEPVEQLTMLRAMPNFNVFRPCDAQETNAGWYLAMTSKTTPTALVLSRQNLPQIKGSSREALKGEIIIIASGSEVTLAVEAKKRIRGKAIRVVSMPSMDIFKQQSREYRESILPPGIEKRIAIEAGSRMSWGEFVGLKGKYITMDSFGASAPADELFKRYGFTVDNVVKMINKL